MFDSVCANVVRSIVE